MPIPADYRELPFDELRLPHVEAVWSFDASSRGVHIVLPDGRMDLIVRYRVDSRGLVVDMEPAIVGPSQSPSRVMVADGEAFFGLRYRAGWGGVCLGIDPSSLRDRGLHGDAAADRLGDDIDALRQAASPNALKDALIDVGRRRVASKVLPAGAIRAIDLLHLTGGRIAVADISRAVGVPERTLRRHVANTVGLPFKALAAVLRFQRTMRLLAPNHGPGLALAHAALEGGYSDQAHMTREFRRYGGFTPGGRPPVAFGSLQIGEVAEMFKNWRGAPV